MQVSAVRHILILLIISLTASGHVYAQTGSSAYSFLDVTTSAHAYTLGGITPALVASDITLVEQNPGLLGPEIDKQLAAAYMHYFGASNFGSIRFGAPAGDRGAWAIGLRYLNHGTMTQTDPDGNMGGTFTPQDIVFEGTYSHDFTDRLRGGITLKGAYSTYEQYTAFALAADLGINYYDEERDLSLSAVITNAGGQLKRFDRAYDRLPFDIRLGYMQGLGTTPFSLSISAYNLTRWKLPYYLHNSNDENKQQKVSSKFFPTFFRHLAFGLQYSPKELFYLGLGYNYKMASDMSSYKRNFLSGFSLGGGLNVKGFSLGVSYAMPHAHANTVVLNLAVTIGELMR